MNDESQDHGRPLYPWPAPPLRLAGVDDDAAVLDEPHIVRGID
ncbi:hypothetical protein [Streptomyces sp. S.PNR 29]|nr:hypothetical protein [Streptomyces sp. S.PNR 29]MDN0197959.1 hypothetical protein [Streptomyces sp. S.PNR 29]